MRTFAATQRWRERWPGATVGCMVVSADTNPQHSNDLEERLQEIETWLRNRYAEMDRAAIRATAPFDAYDRYYKSFGQNYHVMHQVESVALKGKAIPRRAALVEAAFAEELRSGLLTALHDAEAIGADIVADAATGDEQVVLYNGKTVTLDAGDMFMRDEHGILTSDIRGPAAYGLVQTETTRVAVCVYAPAFVGVETVLRHLEAIATNLRLVAPEASVDLLEVIQAD